MCFYHLHHIDMNDIPVQWYTKLRWQRVAGGETVGFQNILCARDDPGAKTGVVTKVAVI